MNEVQLRLFMTNGLLTYRINFFQTCTKARVFEELTTGKASAEAVALAIGNLKDLSQKEMNELRDQCFMLSWAN